MDSPDNRTPLEPDFEWEDEEEESEEFLFWSDEFSVSFVDDEPFIDSEIRDIPIVEVHASFVIEDAEELERFFRALTYPYMPGTNFSVN